MDVGIPSEFIPETEEIAPPELETTPTPEIVPDYPEIVPDEPELVYNNPLRESCPQDTTQGSIIPSLFYKPSIQKKRLRKTIKKVQEQPRGPLALEYLPDTSTQTVPLAQQDIRNVRKLPSMQPKTLRRDRFSVVGPPTFSCAICGHRFTRKHDLQRHLASRNVHKNLNLAAIQPSLSKYVRGSNRFTLPPGTDFNPPPEETFPLPEDTFGMWGEEEFEPEITTEIKRPTLITPQIVRKPRLITPQLVKKPQLITPQLSAKPILGKRTHGKAKLGNPRFKNKKRLEDRPIEEEEFNAWTF